MAVRRRTTPFCKGSILRLKAEEKPSDSPEMLRSVLSRTKDKRKWCATLLLANKILLL